MLKNEERIWLTDKLGDLAVFMVTALILGQLVNKQFRIDHTVIGLIGVALIFVYCHLLFKKI